ncbi:MAG: response regulator [Pseudomonadota bacterium]
MPDDIKERGPTPSIDALRVLIVEDEAIIALDLAFQVEDVGYVVVGKAVDFASCKKLAEQEKPDFALMDMRLKGGDSGAEVATWLREIMDVPCIFISGNLDEETRNMLSVLNPIAFVGKPITPAALRSALLKVFR